MCVQPEGSNGLTLAMLLQFVPEENHGKLGGRSAAAEGGERAGPKTARTTRPSAASPWRSQRIALKREEWPEICQDTEGNVGDGSPANRRGATCPLGQMEGW